MSADRTRELWTRFLEGEDLSPGEERELLEAVRQDEELRREFTEDDQISGLLEGLGSAEGGEFAEAFAVRLEAERDASGFIDRVRVEMSAGESKKISRSAFRRRRDAAPSASWRILLVAAGVILAFGVILLAVSPSAPPATPSARTRVAPPVPKPAPRPAPVPEKPGTPPKPEPRKPAAVNPPSSVPIPSETGKPRPRPPELKERRVAVAPPAPNVPVPKPPVRPATEVVVATLTGTNGEVRVNGGSAIPRDLKTGAALQTAGAKSFAEFRFPDATRIRLEGDSRLSDLRAAGGKHMHLSRGTLQAEVSKQADPMGVSTPHGRATVLGTTLRIRVGADSTRLDVLEGRVRLTRESDGKSVVVRAGHFAIAGEGVALQSKSLPTSEIVLLPEEGRLVGDDWQLVRDPEASSGFALEAAPSRRTPTFEELDRLTSWVEFGFFAEGGKTYALWIRGRTIASGNPMTSDAVNVRPLNAALILPDGRPADRRVNYNGYSQRPRYWWVGGDGDLFDASGKRAGLRSGGIRHGDEIPVRVRFAKTGWQTLKIYPNESPMRIDAVWLSRSRTSRPADTLKAPASK